jgi:hypothetical protein
MVAQEQILGGGQWARITCIGHAKGSPLAVSRGPLFDALGPC